MSWQLPALFLLLIGGVIGDRFDQRRILVATHLLAGIPPLVVAYPDQQRIAVVCRARKLWADRRHFYRPFAAGAGRAGESGCRRTDSAHRHRRHGDAMDAADGRVCIASLADSVGVVPLMMFQSGVMMLGALAVMRVSVPPVSHPAVHEPPLQAIRSGLAGSAAIARYPSRGDAHHGDRRFLRWRLCGAAAADRARCLCRDGCGYFSGLCAPTCSVPWWRASGCCAVVAWRGRGGRYSWRC